MVQPFTVGSVYDYGTFTFESKADVLERSKEYWNPDKTQFWTDAGIDLVMIPAKAGPQAVSDLIAGQVDVYFGNASELLPHINSDKIRLLVAGTAQRIGAAPDIPTVAETLPGFEFSSWNGFSAPAGTPEPIMTAVRDEITALAKSPEVSERLTKLGIIPGGLTRAESEAVFKKETHYRSGEHEVSGRSRKHDHGRHPDPVAEPP